MKKESVIELLREMPEEIDAEELIYRLYLKQKLETAERAVLAGDLVVHEEVVKRSDKWLK